MNFRRLGAGIVVGTGFGEDLLEQGPDAFLLLTADGTIAFVNSAAERRCACSPQGARYPYSSPGGC